MLAAKTNKYCNKELISEINNNFENEFDIEYNHIYTYTKRICDFYLALFGLIFLSPLFLLIAIIIKISDGGPVFYKHKRVGQNDSELYIWKFRTMKPDSRNLEEILTSEQYKKFKEDYKLNDDPRVTPFGKFLRITSLDELPQLYNILIGDLSFVGPRPVLQEETELYGNNRSLFLSVKPGLTGLWQVSGRNNISYNRRKKLELFYCRKHSFLFDIKIFFATFVAVLKCDGAR
jgi:lipopolysaccharide/colanic/teichoic acid biosynthesis glycosyltransferase